MNDQTVMEEKTLLQLGVRVEASAETAFRRRCRNGAAARKTRNHAGCALSCSGLAL